MGKVEGVTVGVGKEKARIGRSGLLKLVFKFENTTGFKNWQFSACEACNAGRAARPYVCKTETFLTTSQNPKTGMRRVSRLLAPASVRYLKSPKESPAPPPARRILRGLGVACAASSAKS